MSRAYYESLLSGHGSSEEEVGLFGAYADAARLRRAAYALASDELEEGAWVTDEAPAVALRGVPLMRMAADDGTGARTLSEHPIEVDGAEDWAVSVGSEPTIDGGSLFTVERIWLGDGAAPQAPAIAVMIAGEETGVTIHLALKPAEIRRQAAVAISPSGRLSALAWTVAMDD